MINANLEQFLDYGWFNEATLYYKGYTYWCEANWDESVSKKFHFFVYKYRSVIYDEIYTKRLVENGDVVDYSTPIDIYVETEQEAKDYFFSAKIFDGKSFWEVEEELAWYDEF